MYKIAFRLMAMGYIFGVVIQLYLQVTEGVPTPGRLTGLVGVAIGMWALMHLIAKSVAERVEGKKEA